MSNDAAPKKAGTWNPRTKLTREFLVKHIDLPMYRVATLAGVCESSVHNAYKRLGIQRPRARKSRRPAPVPMHEVAFHDNSQRLALFVDPSYAETFIKALPAAMQTLVSVSEVRVQVEGN